MSNNGTAEKKTSIPHDERPLIKDLLEQHAASIEDVRRRILSDETVGKPLWDAKRYDDIWILRYVLSHKENCESATMAALKTMKMRDELNWNEELGDIRHRIKNFGFGKDDSVESLPSYELYNRYIGKNSIVVSHPDPDRGVVAYLDFSNADFEGMAANMSDEQLKEQLLHINEAIYQILDEATRRTGKLTKLTGIFDLSNFSFHKLNYKLFKRDAAVQKQVENYHPQLVGKIHMFNPPGWFNAVWMILRPFFPSRVFEKLDVVSTSASQKLHENFLNDVSEENLPERFGGKNKAWPLPSIAETMTAAAANE
mmetsp:Transcript_11100/g.26667  ORF Transcript_11100/g.26667 Transcript_11100/m.26667 type:complete len:312 (-) Transcript_11100:52-987(-)|eukprot:CAMPEP_0197193194 /NCGR_PEP_ID=MMETSP1423-20130617/26670_1 /TAXON_ID=476441 /ORGANISM="Pseudo-nitzschia heimii, Strain UNC1101" /LENGTH=311 /DNA_ID=CAMNT_0042646313 /DNA_START=14 /DNA_END=949 /DNA_ORIENTATION=-